MQVSFQYAAQLAGAAGCDGETRDIDPGTTLLAALTHLAQSHNSLYTDLLFAKDGQFCSSILIAIDNVQIDTASPPTLDTDCTVTIITPMSGG